MMINISKMLETKPGSMCVLLLLYAVDLPYGQYSVSTLQIRTEKLSGLIQLSGDTQLMQDRERFGRGLYTVPKSFPSPTKAKHIFTTGFLSLKEVADSHTGRAV